MSKTFSVTGPYRATTGRRRWCVTVQQGSISSTRRFASLPEAEAFIASRARVAA